MSWFDDRPWLQTLEQSPDSLREIPESTMPALFDETVRNHPEAAALAYFGYRPTFAQVDEMAEALAAYLAAQGFGEGDRLGIYLQNVPHYMIAVFAVWKLGGIVVPLNPMYRDELDHVFADANVTALVVSAAAWNDRVRPHGEHLPIVLTCGERDFAVEQPEAVFGPAGAEAGADTGRQDFLAALEAHRGQRVPHRETSPDDPGIIGYTSGTSGRSKGALVLQRGLAANAQMLKVLRGYGPDSAIFALAPVFHITGFVCLFLAAVAAGARLVLNGRFEPATALALFRTERPTYMAGPATAYLALLAHPDFQGDEFDSFDEIMSGGAPLPEGVVRRFEDRTGYYIGQGYGLTETTAQCIVVPRGLRAPVDPDSGNLSCGLPLASTVVRVLDDEGAPVGPGEVGEICVRGPMVVREYINNPEATAREIPDGELHTGDVGFMDADGWVFIVDRKKDMINASGYKVWPREVEDVLFTHPAVQEAAVVGVPDDYRGESVAAFVTLHRGAQATEREIIDYCREHLASYKAPRTVTFIDELPKTASGKVLRREIRADAAESADAAEPVESAESAPGAGA